MRQSKHAAAKKRDARFAPAVCLLQKRSPGKAEAIDDDLTGDLGCQCTRTRDCLTTRRKPALELTYQMMLPDVTTCKVLLSA